MLRQTTIVALSAILVVGQSQRSAATLVAQERPAALVAQERTQAELDTPKLMDVLSVKAGMTVADIGAGYGAMTVVLARRLGSGHVFASDIGEPQLAGIRESVTRERLSNVTVLEGAAASTNLPMECCEAIFLRHVYHHIGAVEAFNKSLNASLKPGGRLAIIDFVPLPGSALPDGVPANRGGHGIPPTVVIGEMKSAGLVHARTIDKWPPDDKDPTYFLTLFTKP